MSLVEVCSLLVSLTLKVGLVDQKVIKRKHPQVKITVTWRFFL